MSHVYTSDQEFLLFTSIEDPNSYKTGYINYKLIEDGKRTKDELATKICPKGYQYRFIKGDELQRMIDDGKIN